MKIHPIEDPNHIDFMCPNCNELWTIEEFDAQYCGACGFPEHDNDEGDEIWVDDDEFWDD